MDDVKRPPTSNNGTHGISNSSDSTSPNITGHSSPRVDASDSSSTSIPVSFGHKPVERPHNFDTYQAPSEHTNDVPHRNDSYPSHESFGSEDQTESYAVEPEKAKNSDYDNEPQPSNDSESSNEPELAKEPTTVQTQEKTTPHQEANGQAPVFDTPDAKLESPSENSSDQSTSQKGAGLDLSSLSNDDAKELGVQKPAAEDVPIPATALTANKPKKNNKTTFIVVAILIALALIAGAGYAYMQSGKKTSSKTQTPAPAAETKTTKTEVKAADIDKTSADLDSSLKKVDDTKDFAATDLDDSTLGLQ